MTLRASQLISFRLAFLLVMTLGGLTFSAAPSQAAVTANAAAPNDFVMFHNDFYWVDSDGARILTRSGCLDNFNGTYYWYGGNPRGFREQYCYSSKDLIHWTNHGVIFQQDFDANRIDVLYNDTTKQYVMFLKYNGNGAHFAIATSEKPEGPFTFKSQTLVDDALMGDMAMYKDTDGKAYLCYVSWAVGTNAQHGLYRMSDDYMTLDKRMFLWNIRGREAPHMFKLNGLYYYGTSKTAGIQSSGTSYYTATNLEGPWTPAKPLPTPGSNNSWDTQVDFVYPFVGTAGTTYMFAGDRWTKNLPTGRNGDYIWLPMEFNGAEPVVHYYQDWELSASAGTWRAFDPARNLAQGKSVAASSEDGTNVAKHVTDPKTYENYINTFWSSAVSDPQWISVDLGAPTDINRVILKWGTTAAKEFKLQVSTDGAAWTDVFSTTKGSSYSVTDEKFETTSARYVRMNATQRAAAPAGGRGLGRGRGAAATQGSPATQAAPATQGTTPARGARGGRAGQGGPATQPARPAGYSLFDFMVLKD